MALKATDARKLIRRLLREGIFRATIHARAEMKKDDLTDADAQAVLQSGVVHEGEWENGGWRYRVDVHGNPGRRFVVELDEAFDDVMPAEDADVSTKTITIITAMKLEHR